MPQDFDDGCAGCGDTFSLTYPVSWIRMRYSNGASEWVKPVPGLVVEAPWPFVLQFAHIGCVGLDRISKTDKIKW